MRGFNVTPRPPWFSGSLAITEEAFFEDLAAADAAAAARLPAFFARCRRLGLDVAGGDGAMVIRWLSEDAGKVGFASVLTDGRVDTRTICSTAREIGAREIGEAYLEGIAALLGDATVQRAGGDRTWRVERHGDLPRIGDLLAVSDGWLVLIETAMKDLRDAARRRAG